MNHPNRSRTNRGRDADPTAAEIRDARERAGLTQMEAAERIHSPLSAWQSWESAGEEHRSMHPGLFELFLIKTGQTCVPGRGDANDGDAFDEPARFDESDLYVTRYGLRRIANRQVQPTAASKLRLIRPGG